MNNKILKTDIIGLGPNSNKVKEYKNSLIKLSNIQKEAAIGLLLGDASLQSQNEGKTYRIKFAFQRWSCIKQARGNEVIKTKHMHYMCLLFLINGFYLSLIKNL